MPSQYVFTYGSLMEQASRTRTVPSALYVYPVEVKGIRRGWFEQEQESPSLQPTYLGAVFAEESICNGVIFAVNEEELQKLDRRERNYTRRGIPLKTITFLDNRGGFEKIDDVVVSFYESKTISPPNPAFPIVQSYVDICVGGCLQVEKNFLIPKEESFVMKFFKSTEGWERTWFNDRVYPWRPFIYVPDAEVIDRAIKKGLEDQKYDIQIPSFHASNLQFQITQQADKGKSELTIKIVGET